MYLFHTNKRKREAKIPIHTLRSYFPLHTQLLHKSKNRVVYTAITGRANTWFKCFIESIFKSIKSTAFVSIIHNAATVLLLTNSFVSISSAFICSELDCSCFYYSEFSSTHASLDQLIVEAFPKGLLRKFLNFLWNVFIFAIFYETFFPSRNPSFIHFSGSCEHGTFPCEEHGVIHCLPQHLICRIDKCRTKYSVLCGFFILGHYEFMFQVADSSVDRNNTRNMTSKCGKLYLNRKNVKLLLIYSFLTIVLQILISFRITRAIVLRAMFCAVMKTWPLYQYYRLM